jgi:hypothetical protein
MAGFPVDSLIFSEFSNFLFTICLFTWPKGFCLNVFERGVNIYTQLEILEKDGAGKY